MQTCGDLLSKLEHDLKRLDAADSRAEVEYAAFDFAVSQWSMRDWIAYELKRIRERSWIRDIPPEQVAHLPADKDGVGQLAADKCGAVLALRDFANGTKHASTKISGFKDTAPQYVVTSTFVADYEADWKVLLEQMVRQMQEGGDAEQWGYRVAYVDHATGERRIAKLRDLCESALAFWTELIHTNGLD